MLPNPQSLGFINENNMFDIQKREKTRKSHSNLTKNVDPENFKQ